MKKKIAIIKKSIVRFNANIKHFIGRRFLLTWLDEIFSFIIFGASPDDYFRYEFYRKSWSERNSFITYRRSKRIIKEHNLSNYDAIKMITDKTMSNTVFAEFSKREWINLDSCTEEELNAFLKKHGRIILKPKDGSCGKGVEIVDSLTMSECSEKYQHYIGEEIIVQHPDIAKLNPSCVNSLRAISFRGEIISCVLKVGGANAIVDNMCSGGMYGNVNLEYGITDSLFFDIELNRYAYHPTSGAKLVGVEIPHWSKIGEFVREASKKTPYAEYIGWDIAILSDGFGIIEPNEAPGHDLSCQSTVQKGLLGKIKEIRD